MFSLVCAILISTIVCSYSFKIGIKARILDPAGRDTSFLFDGGSVEISCWQIADDGGKILKLQGQDSKPGNFRYFTLVNISNSKLRHNISINSTSISTSYYCKDEKWRYSGTIRIKYILCNPMSVKPRRSCTERGKLCHVKDKRLAECKRLKKSRCLLGHSSDKISEHQKDTQLLPKFNGVCGARKTTKLGLCHSLANSPDQTVRFVTSDTKRCNLDFQLYICGEDCKSKTNLTMMTGWDFVDAAKSFSIYVQVKSETTHSSAVSCDIAYTRNDEIMSSKVTFQSDNKKLYNADVISEQLKELPTPTIADIVCNVIYWNDALLRYQTSLLVFNSNKDLYYNVKQYGDDETYKFIVNVTAAYGLFVCAEKWKGCSPTEAAAVLKRVGDGFGAFYVRLFASSPKRKYVPINEKILNKSNINNTAGSSSTTRKPDSQINTTDGGRATHKPDTKYSTMVSSRTTFKSEAKSNTVGAGGNTHMPDTNTNTTSGGQELQSKKSLSGIGWMIGVAVASVIGTIAVVAAITIAILCARHKKAKQRQYQGNGPVASPPKALTKLPLKDVKAIPSLDSVVMTSSKELVTAAYPNMLSKSPSKETEKAQTHYSQTEPYTSDISTVNAYETIYSRRNR